MNGSAQGNFHQSTRALPSIGLWQTMLNVGFSLDVAITRGSYAVFLVWSAVVILWVFSTRRVRIRPGQLWPSRHFADGKPLQLFAIGARPRMSDSCSPH